MKKIGEYIDSGVELFIEKIYSKVPYGVFGFNYSVGDIDNILKLFDKNQIIQGLGDMVFYCYALLEDGRLISLSYRFNENLCHVKYSARENSNGCTVQTITVSKSLNSKYFQIVDEDGDVIEGPTFVPEYASEDLNCPITKILTPVSIKQLEDRGIKELTREDCANDVIYDLVKLINGKQNSETNSHDENMQQSKIFKLFDEYQMVSTESENGVETCWVILDDKVIRIMCIPPISNNEGNTYWMSICPNADKYEIYPIIDDDGRTRVQIKYDKEVEIYSDGPAYLNTPKSLIRGCHLSELISPVTVRQILERIRNQRQK